MAVVNVKSTQLTARDTVPISFIPANYGNGVLHAIADTVEIANGDSIASIYRMFALPGNAVVHRLLYYCDAITSGAGDVGCYQTTLNGSAVVDVDYFASAISIASAITQGTDIAHEADATDAGTGFGLADVTKMLWQGLQVTADPARDYDVCLTLTAAAAAAGTFALRCMFTTNG